MIRNMKLIAALCVAAILVSILPYARQASAAVPSPWQQQDIGSVGLAGSANYASGTYTLQGSGTDIAGTSDQFHYVYQSLNGDGTIVARVASISNTGPWAKGGVMIRESLAGGSKHVSTVIEYASTSGAQMIQRSALNGSTATATTTGVAAPYWVKLQRSGNTFTSSISSNGTSWTQVGTASVTMAANVYIGLVVSAQNNASLNTTVIDNVSLTGSTGGGSSPAVYEAESGTYAGGGQQQNAANASNGKVVGNLNNVGAYSQVGGVNGGTGGNATLVVRFANGYGSARSLSLYVNGVKQQQLSFANTGGWNTFADTASLTITLNSGTGNTIKIQRDSADNPAADIDKYTVTPNSGSSGTGNRSGLPWMSGMYRVTDDQANWSAVQSFENWRGRLVDTITNFPYRSSWDLLTNTGAFFSGWQGSPWTQVYAIPMFPENIGATFSACASGSYNSHWTTFGQKLQNSGQGNSIIRLGWEFNGDWFAHSVTAANLNDWKACYRQVALTIRAAAPGVKFDWNVNRGHGLKADNNADPALAYPGDDVVDYVGVDSYDQWPPVFNDTTWNNSHLNGSYGLQHWVDFAVAHGKKFSVPEWGLYHGAAPNYGNDNPFYITKMWNFFSSLGSELAYEGYYDDDQLTLGNLSYGSNNPNSAPVYNSHW